MITAYIFKALRQSLQLMIVLILTVTFGSALMAQVKEAFAANLKSVATVEDNVLRAGDIFDGLGANADKVLGGAPEPGRDMVLNSRTLLRIALALNIDWRPSGREQIVVRRDATTVPLDKMKDLLVKELGEKGAPEQFDIKYLDKPDAFVLPKSEGATAEIAKISYTPSEDYFEAEFVAPSRDRPLKRQTIRGKLEKIVSVPVLSQTIQHGTLISAADIQWIDLPAYKLQHDLVLKAENLVNMTPRRMAVAGEPLRHNEVQTPLMVERGEMITIIYNNGPIKLTAEGKALQNGADKETIRVVNNASSRTVQAMITGDRTVTVQ